MALADTARLVVDLSLKGDFNAHLRASQKALTDFDKQITGTQGRAYKAGTQIGTGIKRGAVLAAGAIGFLAANVGLGLKSLTELEQVTTQTNAVLKSTKGVAGQTAESVRNLAEKYESLNAIVDDKVIQSAENVLLTFTAVRKQAFEPAIKAALDMSTALGTDLQGSVIQIGKALQDPIRGITALRRVGVNFSQDQIKVIKRLVETGHTLEAQKVILKELNTEFGGSFLAQGQTTAGKVAKFKDAIEDLQKALATALLPTIGKVADGLTKFLADPKVVRSISDLGQKIAGLFSDKNLAEGGKFLQDAFATAKTAAPVIEASARATLSIVQAAVGLFKSLPAPIQQLAVGAFAINKLTGGLVTNVVGGIADLLIKQRGATPANPLFVVDVGKGIGGVVGGAATAAGGAGLAGAALAVAVPTILVGGTAVSLNAIADYAAKNNELAAKGLSFNEIEAVKFYNSSLAEQEQARKHLGRLPTKADFDSGMAKLGQQVQGNVTPGGFDTRLTGTGTSAKASGGKDDFASLSYLATLQRSAISVLRDGFRAMTASLRNARTDKQIRVALSNADRQIFQKGLGGSGGAKNVLRELKGALSRTHDPQLQRALRAEIAKVERKIVGRQLVERQLRKADQIYRSSESTKHKIEDLKSIERDLKNRGVPNAAKQVQNKIEALRRASTYAQRATTEAIKDKDLSITSNITVKTSTFVSSRETSKTQTTFKKYFSTAS